MNLTINAAKKWDLTNTCLKKFKLSKKKSIQNESLSQTQCLR
jgi:hypothetical protein